MEDGQSKGRKADQIDFPIMWAVVRGAQILLVVVESKQVYLSLGTDSLVLSLFASIGVLLIFGAFVHGVATGTADSSGIVYRRYFRSKVVAWTDVVEIQWIKSRLNVLLKGRGRQRKTVVFLLNPLKSEVACWLRGSGEEFGPPEILERIRALPIETPPITTSAAQFSRWILRMFLAFGVFIVLVVLWRLLSVPAHVSH